MNEVHEDDTAAEICRLVESFHENCQNHPIQQLAKHAPDADSVSDWGVIFAAHNAIETTWGWRDTDLQTRLQSRLWSEALGVSFAGADQIVGNVLDVVPKNTFHMYTVLRRGECSKWRNHNCTICPSGRQY